MKIALIFPPFMVPTYIPFGIAQLKSYVENELPSTQVTNFDFNKHLFINLKKNDFLEKLPILCKLCPNQCKIDKREMKKILNNGEIFKIAVDCLNGKDSDEFYHSKKYNYFKSKIDSFWNTRESCFRTVINELIRKGLSAHPEFDRLFEENVELVSSANPDIVGFSIFHRGQLYYSLAFAEIIKRKFNLPILFGGASMSYIDIQQLFNQFNFVDFVISKEGEISLMELCRNFRERKFNNVPGLHYRNNKKILFNNEKYIANLDSLPAPDFSDFKLNQYLAPKPVLPISFSRGCYWRKCSFCTYHKKYPVSYKKKSFEKFISEIRLYNTLGINHFFIVDTVISALDLKAISTALKKNKMHIFFGAIVRVEKDFSRKLFSSLYAAGCRLLVWGVESSGQRILDLMRKGTNIKTIKRVLKRSAEKGLQNHVFMIQGFPTQTEQEIIEDLSFLANNRIFIHSYFLHQFSLDRGSYIFHNPHKFGVRDLKPRIASSVFEDMITTPSTAFDYEADSKLNSKSIDKMTKEILGRSGSAIYGEYDNLDFLNYLLHAVGRKSDSIK